MKHKPLVTHMYTADPRAHVFNDKVYIYTSHDIEAGIPENDFGDHFDMRDYHVLSMASIPGEVTDHGVALDIKDIPWAGRQLWSNDCATKDGKYYLYYPMKDKTDVFRLGVAISDSPSGPFKPEPEPMEGSFSIDPCVFCDTDGQYYMYWGGIWGGQLQRWITGKYDPTVGQEPDTESPAIGPRIAKLRDDMLGYAEEIKEIRILDEEGNPLKGTDHNRRFFEACWMHKYNGKYYLSYSTGNTHLILYAIGDNPYGPFTYQGVILTPVLGWTTHHSILEFKGKWYLYYHDCELSAGKTHLRSIKVRELRYNPDGSIVTMDGGN
ncbi:glycoside hydrolase family 43 protein [bacterium]|nr:glycoside hydrolase family 43 protein [bacterium]